MLFQSEVVTPFATGAAAGLGHVFGQQFLPWVARKWNWLWGRSPKPATAALPGTTGESLLKKVTLEDVADGIPEGYQLCRFSGDKLEEKYVATVPEKIGKGESLWLVPTGEIWVTAGLPNGENSATAEVAVEFDPDDGLASLFATDQELNRDWLGSLIAGSLSGVLLMLGKQGSEALLAGDSSAADGCRQRLDQALHTKGLRCRAVRPVSETPAEASDGNDPALTDLAHEVGKVKTTSDWDQLVGGLKAAGVPVDPPAAKQLEQLRDEVIRKSIAPNQAVTGLARLTVEAFERAGIQQPDLTRWQNISDRLRDMNSETETAPITSQSVPVGVATTKRPSTWCVWSRIEVDRRLLQFTRRSVRHCRAACDQALASLRDMPALRQVRDLNAQLQVVEELLASMPPLDPRAYSLRIDTHTAKNLVKSLEEAVLVTESLSKQTDTLFSQTSSSPAWNEALQHCLRSVSKLSQYVRDRRTVR